MNARPFPPLSTGTWPRWSALPLAGWRAWYGIAGLALCGLALAALWWAGVGGAWALPLQFVLFAAAALTVPVLAQGRQALAAFGWRPAQPRRAALLVLGITALVLGAAELVEALSPSARHAARAVLRSFGFGRSASHDAVLVLCIVTLAPLGEELLFRGLLYRSLRDGLAQRGWPVLGMLLAALVSAGLFAASHRGDGFDQQLLQLAVMGALAALIYELTGTMAAPMLLHSLNNTVALQAGLARDSSVRLASVWVEALAWAGPALTLLLLVLLNAWLGAGRAPRGG